MCYVCCVIRLVVLFSLCTYKDFRNAVSIPRVRFWLPLRSYTMEPGSTMECCAQFHHGEKLFLTVSQEERSTGECCGLPRSPVLAVGAWLAAGILGSCSPQAVQCFELCSSFFNRAGCAMAWCRTNLHGKVELPNFCPGQTNQRTLE